MSTITSKAPTTKAEKPLEENKASDMSIRGDQFEQHMAIAMLAAYFGGSVQKSADKVLSPICRAFSRDVFSRMSNRWNLPL